MNIPAQYQVFDKPVSLIDKDSVRLKVYLISWDRLAERLIEGINEPDVERLIVLELMGKRRTKLLDRLLMRLGRLQRRRIAEKVHALCSNAT